MGVMIKYCYDGSKFYGMQRQKDFVTVQGEIEKILYKVFNQNINLISSGRTDAFVHAKMQVSNFVIDKKIPLEAIKKQINKRLYGKVYIYDIKEVSLDFNSRFDAKKRIYEYILKYEKNILPFEAQYISKIPDSQKIDLNLINEKLKLFIGTHDFSAFCKIEKDKKISNIRTIYNAKCYKNDDRYIFLIEGNGFLKSMVRLLIASCIYNSIDRIIEKLNLIDINKPKKILDPHGLYLKEVIYDN